MLPVDSSTALDLGAALACGLMIGIEQGWRLRLQKTGTRVAGVRTYSLIGLGGGLASVLGLAVHLLVAPVIAGGIVAALVIGYAREPGRIDATGVVSALVVLGLGMLAGGGHPALGVGAASVVTLLLASRSQSHRFVASLNQTDVQAFARYAVVSAAVLPFLPNKHVGPLGAWNPFQLWLVVVLVTGFSFVGYIANRTIGQRWGVIATAIIGGAYSSTAVTASLSERLGHGERGPLSAGIVLASAVMYFRVLILVGVLSPSTLLQFFLVIAPSTLTATIVALIAWIRSAGSTDSRASIERNPIEIVPALGFVGIVAIGAVATRWAQISYGQAGIATSLFITGTFDVDAAIVTLSGLPMTAISRELAAVALAGTIVTNMVLKMLVCAAYARRDGTVAIVGLGASTATLLITIVVRLAAIV